MLLLAAACAAQIVDGDTLHLCGEKIRLIGIDAPEKAGHCRPGRICAQGDPQTSTESLEAVAKRGKFAVRRFGKDRYGRTLALVSADGTDMSCWQLSRGAAIYVPKWDEKGELARICKAAR